MYRVIIISYKFVIFTVNSLLLKIISENFQLLRMYAGIFAYAKVSFKIASCTVDKIRICRKRIALLSASCVLSGIPCMCCTIV